MAKKHNAQFAGCDAGRPPGQAGERPGMTLPHKAGELLKLLHADRTLHKDSPQQWMQIGRSKPDRHLLLYRIALNGRR